MALPKWHASKSEDKVRGRSSVSAMHSGVHRLSADFSHGYFPVNNLYHVAADTHVRDDIALFVGANVEIAWPSRLDSLLDQALCSGRKHTISHGPCGTATGRRPGSGVLAVIEDHTCMKCGIPRDRLAANK